MAWWYWYEVFQRMHMFFFVTGPANRRGHRPQQQYACLETGITAVVMLDQHFSPGELKETFVVSPSVKQAHLTTTVSACTLRRHQDGGCYDGPTLSPLHCACGQSPCRVATGTLVFFFFACLNVETAFKASLLCVK